MPELLSDATLADLVKLARRGGVRDTIQADGRRFLFTLEPIDDCTQEGDEAGDEDALASIADLEAELLREGDAGQRRVLDAPDMLSLSEAAEHSGIPVRTLTQMRHENRLLALSRPGARRGFRFPAFQFEAKVIDVLPRILAPFGLTRAWQAYDFLTHPEPLLGGAVPLERLRRANARQEVLDEVIRTAEAAAALDHGAH